MIYVLSTTDSIYSCSTLNILLSCESLSLSLCSCSVEKGDAHHGPFAIPGVLLRVHILQCRFFERDAICKEAPRCRGIRNDAYGVAQKHLRSNRPPKPAKIRGMTKYGVYSSRHQTMTAISACLHNVVEVGPCRVHCQRPAALSRKNQHAP